MNLSIYLCFIANCMNLIFGRVINLCLERFQSAQLESFLNDNYFHNVENYYENEDNIKQWKYLTG